MTQNIQVFSLTKVLHIIYDGANWEYESLTLTEGFRKISSSPEITFRYPTFKV